ncbi:F0F1 ATP synthase subunit delta [Chungangia koreensis]|uniref:ATP synthase subunit delta n=1 Tax=Chungangia koreensis TaxID=752657 RepID=A0ABV8X6M9_9LACT
MSRSAVAKRYAVALFELAQEHQILQPVVEDIRGIQAVVKANPELKQLMTSPKISSERKKGILSELFATANPLVLNTLYVLQDAKRLGELNDFADEFVLLANKAFGIAEAKVFSTRPLSEEERNSISTAFAAKIGKTSLQIENVIEPSLIGGLRLQIGNRIYDNSIRTKLDHLKRQLIG